MCYVCNCFGWILDLIQRVLTFVLTCWMAFAVCCGLAIAIIAGIAYGYNYCMAEWITLTRSDVRVYMRRGQFYDRPDLLQAKRRSGDEEEDTFPYNLTEDIQQEYPAGQNSVATEWKKIQDLKNYAEKLANYSDSQKTFVDAGEQVELPENNIYYKFTSPPIRRVSIIPNPFVSTTVLQSGTSEIVMRKFHPLPNSVAENTDENEEYEEHFNKINISDFATTPLEQRGRKTEPMVPDIKIRLEDSPKRKTINMRHWGTTLKPIILDYSADVDEDKIVYKAV